jgi:DsbC/DsbD-like thiol-disulfide interchange protein
MTIPLPLAQALWPGLRQLIGCLMLSCLGAWAQTSSAPWADTPKPPGSVVQTAHVRAELLAWAPEGVTPDRPLWLGVQLQHQRGWHTYWKNPGDSGLPTQFKWTLPAGLHAGEIDWPLPQQQRVGSLLNHGYEDSVLLPVPVQVSTHSEATTVEIKLHASWLVCERECVPEEGDFVLQLPTRSASVLHASAFQASLAMRPQVLPQVQAQAHVQGAYLDIQVQGLPSNWQGKTLAFFPEHAELLQAGTDGQRQISQRWTGAQWLAHAPLSDLRSTSPDRFTLVLAQGSHGVRLSVPVSGSWPAPASFR